MYKSKITFFCLILLFLIAVKCDNPDKFELPGVYMDFMMDLNRVEYFGLQSAGNSMEISAQMVGVSSLGYDDNGLIVFNNGDEFYAFDRTCPHDFPKSIAVECDNAGTGECPECESVFVFAAIGLPASESPSKHPLKEYRTEFYSGTGFLHIYN